MLKIASFSVFALIVGLAGPALAGGVDLKASTFKWTGTKKVGSKHTGALSLKSADVVRDGGRLKSATFVVDMNSMTNDDLQGEWRDKLLGHLKSDDFFSVSKYPTATLRLDPETKSGVAKGKLTIKDKTHPVEVKYSEKGKGTFVGTLTFDRTKYGVVYGSDNFFKGLGDKVISDKVTVDFSVVLN